MKPHRAISAYHQRSSDCPTSTSSMIRQGQPIGINEHIGRRPIAAFGNSDGDLDMLQWTTLRLSQLADWR
jgi:hypothetical protein